MTLHGERTASSLTSGQLQLGYKEQGRCLYAPTVRDLGCYAFRRGNPHSALLPYLRSISNDCPICTTCQEYHFWAVHHLASSQSHGDSLALLKEGLLILDLLCTKGPGAQTPQPIKASGQLKKESKLNQVESISFFGIELDSSHKHLTNKHA